MATCKLGRYTGYQHNRYDGWQSSWGVLIAAGGKPTADCFVTCNCEPGDEPCNCDGELSLYSFFEGGVVPDDFHATVINNLDKDDYRAITELAVGEAHTAVQYCGGYGKYEYLFCRTLNGLTCTVDNAVKFAVAL